MKLSRLDPCRFPVTLLALSGMVADRTVAIAVSSRLAKGEPQHRTHKQLVSRAMVLATMGER
jgi:hypothetical protein